MPVFFEFATRLAVAAIAMSLAAKPSFAGDAANMQVLGFSADGGIFAFEEFGIQDGSGFPYANRFYINTATDRFLPGTPVRVLLQDENAELAAARNQARQQAQSVISDSILAENPGFEAGRNAITELSADPGRMVVNPRPVVPPIDDALELRLQEIPVAQPQRCENLGEAKGFRLLRIGISAGEQTRLVHEDSNIPTSRGCPLGYMIGGIQTFFPEAGTPVFATLIAIRQVGFEGPDYRWIAVTGQLVD